MQSVYMQNGVQDGLLHPCISAPSYRYYSLEDIGFPNWKGLHFISENTRIERIQLILNMQQVNISTQDQEKL